jgi:hypothetical protein
MSDPIAEAEAKYKADMAAAKASFESSKVEAQYRAAKAAFFEDTSDPKKKKAFLDLKKAVTAAHNEVRADRAEEVGVDHKGRLVYQRVTPIVRTQ